MLKILDRYIIRRFLGTYLFAIAMIIVILVIFDAAEKIDDFLEAHVPISEIFTGYYLNFIPYFVNQFSGLFTFIAVIFFTSKMAYDTEVIAMLSSGISFRRIMWPYFFSATVITATSLLLNLILIPVANQQRIEFETKYMKSDAEKARFYDRYIYRQIDKESDTYVFIRDFDGTDFRAGYFVLESYDGGKIVSSLEAAAATFNPAKGSWTAPKYLLRTFDSLNNEKLIKSETPMDTVINLIPDELGRTEDLIQTMNSWKLSQFIDQQKTKGSNMVAIFQVENHSRYAYPLSTFILTLIGVSLSSRKVRGGTGMHIGVGIALCFSYILLMKFAGEFAKTQMIPAWMSIWLPNFIYLIIGIYLYRKAPK